VGKFCLHLKGVFMVCQYSGNIPFFFVCNLSGDILEQFGQDHQGAAK
jgi:hypothetical protein